MSFIDGDAQQSAQQQAYRYIRDQIVGGAIPGGTKIVPSEIAEVLGISRMPVREALVQLDAEGLVTNRPNRGAIVTPLKPEDVEELFQMRAALEGLAARHAAVKCTEMHLHELEIMAGRMDRAADDAQLWLRHHDEFHDYMCSIPGRARLLAEIRRIRASVHPYLLLYNRVYDRPEMEGAEHRALIDALRTKNGTLAERAVSHHIDTAAVSVIAFLRQRNGTKVAGL
ncbi:GntR family transcriptional regulator [Zavarzinia compransoris]|uniref:GntR family transcriptional regulator n=1 Tax=Zavarzinia marina TaxID=2911065 RepID=UPI001F3B9416|nr:GntR family transcriptional regulator [Zavarzinia marina]MCF4167360.1 GntR family transcriptional regulator [Zavarzinia marina]